ncbi:hypothetical protein [Streptomyces sp. NBC_00648]|uniref:hypothetical protein n=1 Tax=Streptomyces sp. NBC_00648 TaxID=2975797 RepID=UPI00324BC84C
MRPHRRSESRAPLPATRATAFAVVATVLGISAHHLVADGPVPWVRALPAALALFGVGLLGARRPRSLLAVTAVNAVAQAALHTWLGAGTHHGAGMADMPAMHGGAHGAWHERLHHSLAMTAAHAVAAVLVSVLMQRADTVCWSLARGVSAALRPVRAAIAAARALLTGRRPALPGPRRVPLPTRVQPPPHAGVLRDVVVRRGPPAARPTPAF